MLQKRRKAAVETAVQEMVELGSSDDFGLVSAAVARYEGLCHVPSVSTGLRSLWEGLAQQQGEMVDMARYELAGLAHSEEVALLDACIAKYELYGEVLEPEISICRAQREKQCVEANEVVRSLIGSTDYSAISEVLGNFAECPADVEMAQWRELQRHRDELVRSAQSMLLGLCESADVASMDRALSEYAACGESVALEMTMLRQRRAECASASEAAVRNLICCDNIDTIERVLGQFPQRPVDIRQDLWEQLQWRYEELMEGAAVPAQLSASVSLVRSSSLAAAVPMHQMAGTMSSPWVQPAHIRQEMLVTMQSRLQRALQVSTAQPVLLPFCAILYFY